MLPTHASLIAAHNYAQATILIVEDNDDIWLIISMLLKKQLPDVTIRRVVNARQALDCIDEVITHHQALPKLIMQNLYLPLLKDGLDLLQATRGKLVEYAAQQIPILVMSSSDDSDDIRRAYQAGASSFYLKPTDMGQWVAYFERLRHFWWESIILPVT